MHINVISNIKSVIDQHKYDKARREPEPLMDAHDWSEDDHRHFCLARYLLTPECFHEVCHSDTTMYNMVSQAYGMEYQCDYCRYSCTLEYNQKDMGGWEKKWISVTDREGNTICNNELKFTITS